MNITSIFSALGNNSTLYPIIVKDSIDNTGRVMMAYKEGSKNGKNYGMYDARERFIEENATSLVWLGGIPALKLLYDRLVTNKVYKFKNIEALGSGFDKQGKRALADTNLNLLANDGLQTLKGNVDGIREAAKSNDVLKKLVEQADKILENPAKFKKVQALKMAITTVVPLVTVGFLLPRFIQKLTKKIYRKDITLENQQKKASSIVSFTEHPKVFSEFTKQGNSKKSVSFGGKLSTSLVNIFNNSVYNQAILDAGISGGRIYTGINTADKIEKGIKEAGVVFFIYLGGRIVANFLEKIGEKIGMPISLDSKILEDKSFHKKIIDLAKTVNPEEKAKLKKEFLHFVGDDEKSILSFIDNQVKNGVENNSFKNATLKAAQNLGDLSLVEGVKNPLKYVDTKKIKNLNTSLSEFVEKALSKGSVEEVEKFIKKALNTKRSSIVLNLALCSIATAYVLPKIQYMFREKYTKSTNLPSLQTYAEQIEEEEKAAAKAS